MTRPFIAEITLKALADDGHEKLEAYGSMLSRACELSPPPFGEAWYGDKYRALAVEPSWLAQSLIANASKEGEGSRKLWDLVARIEDPNVREQVRQHAIDESRHAQFYLAMLDLAFPSAVTDSLRFQLREISPGYSNSDHPKTEHPSAKEIVLDEIVQMNIGEIRTRIHQLLLRPVIQAHCPAGNLEKLNRLLDTLLNDETRHIAYTATIIEHEADAGASEFLSEVMSQRVADFNEITLKEVQASDFSGA